MPSDIPSGQQTLTNLATIPLSTLIIFFFRCAIAIIPAILFLCFAYFALIVCFGVVGQAARNVVQLMSK